MRRNLLFLAISTMMLFSCSAIKDAITVPVNTTLSLDVPLSVVVTKSATLNDKAGTINSFSTEKELKVANNVDMASYINKIKEVNVTAAKVAISPLVGTDEITTLNVEVTGVTGPVFSITGITATANNPFSPVITPAIQAQLDLVEKVLIKDRAVILKISGTTTVAVGTTLTAKLSMDTKFICTPLN